MKRFVSLVLSVCFLFSINTVSYAANISSRKASNPVIQSMNDKYHVDFSGMSIDELNKFIYPICMRLSEAMISLLLIIQQQHHIVARYAYR
mgnify:CR=1 FL=1